MKKEFCLLSAFLIACCNFSCKKEMQLAQQVVLIDSVATYKIVITGTWKSPVHTVPAGNHFTQFIGMVHSSGSHLFLIRDGSQ